MGLIGVLCAVESWRLVSGPASHALLQSDIPVLYRASLRVHANFYSMPPTLTLAPPCCQTLWPQVEAPSRARSQSTDNGWEIAASDMVEAVLVSSHPGVSRAGPILGGSRWGCVWHGTPLCRQRTLQCKARGEACVRCGKQQSGQPAGCMSLCSCSSLLLTAQLPVSLMHAWTTCCLVWLLTWMLLLLLMRRTAPRQALPRPERSAPRPSRRPRRLSGSALHARCVSGFMGRGAV